MMNHRFFITVITALICLSGLRQAADAQDMDSTASPGLKTPAESTPFGLHFSGFWSMEAGQLENFWLVNNPIHHQNLLRTYLNFGVTKQVTEQLELNAFGEGKMYFNTFDKKYNYGVEAFVLPTMYYSFYFHEADAIYSFGDVKSPYLQFTLGYFPFKYNPDTRDLGEYLYRSGTYPAYLVNDFDFAKARLAGLKITDNFLGIHNDLLLTMGTDRPPFFDLNFGDVLSYDIARAKIFEISGGVMYQSLLSANTGITSPVDASNYYLKDSTLQSGGTYTYDTSYYTFAGPKLMARFSFDPKRFCRSCDNFIFIGDEGFKIFGEAAILGVQNYPANNANNWWGYDTLLHKIPIMLGLNLPSFQFRKFSIFDVLTMEVEYYGCTYPNNYEYKNESPDIFPVPVDPTKVGGTLSEHNYASLDNWKWCFYAKKSFKNGLYLVGQVANDHIRNETPIASSVDMEEALRTDKSWWWALKVGYKF